MDPFFIGTIMFIAGIIFIIVEVATPGMTFAIIPGTMLISLGVIGMVIPGFWDMGPVTVVVAFVITMLIATLTVLMYQRYGPTSKPETTTSASLVGKTGIVTRKVEPHSLKGKVKIESTIWSATSDAAISENTMVKVTDAKGVHVTVEEIQEG